MLCTYSRAAARELKERFVRLASATDCPGDLSRVRIGTIHGLCRRILRSHVRSAGLRSGFEVLNENDQWRLLTQRFDDVFGPDLSALEREGWRWREQRLVIRHGRKFFERICDELINLGGLTGSRDQFHAALGRCYLRYRDLLLVEGRVDFDHLQRWAVELLEDDRIAAPISHGIRYLICDEYQDTSFVQERLLLRLSQSRGNVCVVGDDDQVLYRFRGASVTNLLRFPDHFADCHTAELRVNYRSHPNIVDFYDRWMATAADWSNPDPNGDPFRHPKTITPHDPAVSCQDYPAVIAVESRNAWDEGKQLARAGVVPEAPAGHCRIRPGGAAAALGEGTCGRRILGRSGAGWRTREPRGVRKAATLRFPTGVHRHDHPPGQGPGVGCGDRGFIGL